MDKAAFLLLTGLLALSQAKPQQGYNYPQPAQQQFPIGLQQPIYQQQLNHQSQSPADYYPNNLASQIALNQNQQSTSSQASNLLSSSQIPLNQQTLHTSSASQATSFLRPDQLSSNQHISQPQLNIQTQAPIGPQFLHIVPQTNPHLLNLQTLQLVPNFQQINYPLPAPQQVVTFVPQSQAQAPLVTKHVYVHVAPEEPPLPPQVLPVPPPPRKTYKILFIKAPSLGAQRQVIHVPAPQPATEEKTLVYVLVDRPQQPQVVVPAPAPTQSSKPEVYFIKYKANKPVTSVGAVPNLVASANEQSISSGESSSSLFSGGVRDKYGPPGYQKRSA